MRKDLINCSQYCATACTYILCNLITSGLESIYSAPDLLIVMYAKFTDYRILNKELKLQLKQAGMEGAARSSDMPPVG